MSAPVAHKTGALVIAAALAMTALSGCAQGTKPSVRSESSQALVTTSPTTSPSPSSTQIPPGASLIATAVTKHVDVERSPSPVPAKPRWRLANPNNLGAPLVFEVVGQLPGWWQVRVPARPNGSFGWVSASDVRIELDPYSMTASLHRHVLTVYKYGEVMWRLRIGVGAPDAPTPTGQYYLTELLIAAHPGGPYGPYAYGTSAFSNVFSEFEGGNGQIGVHGTNNPASIGASISHGCIRLHNADISKLAHVIPAGTPLTIRE